MDNINLEQIIANNLPWLSQILIYIATFRLILKPFSTKLQSKMTDVLISVAKSPEVDDDVFLRNILSSKYYRLVVFIVDLLASVKFPTIKEFEEQLKEKKAL